MKKDLLLFSMKERSRFGGQVQPTSSRDRIRCSLLVYSPRFKNIYKTIRVFLLTCQVMCRDGVEALKFGIQEHLHLLFCSELPIWPRLCKHNNSSSISLIIFPASKWSVTSISNKICFSFFLSSFFLKSHFPTFSVKRNGFIHKTKQEIIRPSINGTFKEIYLSSHRVMSSISDLFSLFPSCPVAKCK